MGDQPDLARGLTEYLSGLLEERRDLRRLEALMQNNDNRRAISESAACPRLGGMLFVGSR